MMTVTTMPCLPAAQAQATRPRNEISEQESLHLTKNLLRIAMFNISYIRGLFPESFYKAKFVLALDMKVTKLLPMDLESKRFIDWMEKGVFDALQKKYLRTMFLTICSGQDGPLVEEYMFSFKYAVKGASENITSMTIEHSRGKHVHTDTTNQTTPLQMKQSACKMVRTLVQLMHTLDNVPKERTVVMKLHYYDDVTPADYEPPFFTSSTYEDPDQWAREPLKMKVGRVDSRHCKLAIKMKSVFDPCHDENELARNETCSGLITSDDDSVTSSEAMEENIQPSQPSQPSPKVLPRMDTPIQAPESKEQVEVASKALAKKFKKMRTAEEAHKRDSDKTEDPEFEAESLRSVKSYLQKREDSTIRTTAIVKEFPQISKVLIEELVERLVEEKVLIILKKDLFHIKKTQPIEPKKGPQSNVTQQHYRLKTKTLYFNAETNTISEAPNVSVHAEKQRIHERVLLYTLPREYITLVQLQEALVDVGVGVLRKSMIQMSLDGYIEKRSKNKRKGRQVFHTPEAEKKLQELCAIFNSKKQKNDEPEKNNCDDMMEVSQPWGVLCRANDHSKTGSISGRTQVFGSDITRQDQPMQQEHSKTGSVSGRTQLFGSDITRLDQPIQQEHSANNRHTKAVPTFKEPPLPQKAPTKVPALSKQSAHPNVTPSALGVEGKRIRMPDLDSPLDASMNSQSEVVSLCEPAYHLKASKVDGPIYQPPFKRVRTQ